MQYIIINKPDKDKYKYCSQHDLVELNPIEIRNDKFILPVRVLDDIKFSSQFFELKKLQIKDVKDDELIKNTKLPINTINQK